MLGCLLVGAAGIFSAQAQAPQLINYQGRLLQGTNLVNGNVGLSLRLFNVSSGGSRLYEDSNTVTVVDGLYSTFIGDNTTYGNFFGTLSQTQLWVEVAVNNTALTPRERLASVAFAQRSAGVDISTNPLPSVTVLPQSNVTAPNSYAAVIGGGASNTITSDSWETTINGGLKNYVENSPGVVIGGGRNNQVLFNSPYSTIGGGVGSWITEGSAFTTIGGGSSNFIGQSAANATIGGGNFNRINYNGYSAAISGGENNSVGSFAGYSFIGGGINNTIDDSSPFAVLSGGFGNFISKSNSAAAIGGGFQNSILSAANQAHIGGGANNLIGNGAMQATIPGGFQNEASGVKSFAAGNYAKATNDGAFVWADASANSAFRSTSTNQFLIRAQGGVGINTNKPAAALHVAGEAMIGSVSNPARFGMTVVRLTTTGNLFVHPADTNLIMTWDAALNTFSITNTSGVFYDCQIQMIAENAASPVVASKDIGPGLGNSLRLANTNADNAGWSATAIRENSLGAGFQFNGSGWDNLISGLVIYWY